MAIKMRVNKKEDCICSECGSKKKNVLDMYDICIAGEVFTICDSCNDELFHKSLKAQIYTQSRLKSNEDIKIINSRRIQVTNLGGMTAAEALRGINTKGE